MMGEQDRAKEAVELLQEHAVCRMQHGGRPSDGQWIYDFDAPLAEIGIALQERDELKKELAALKTVEKKEPEKSCGTCGHNGPLKVNCISCRDQKSWQPKAEPVPVEVNQVWRDNESGTYFSVLRFSGGIVYFIGHETKVTWTGLVAFRDGATLYRHADGRLADA